MHLIGLLSIILRYNGFAKIQKDVVDQTGSRSPNSDCYLFGCKFSFGKCFRTSSRSSHWTGRYQLFHTIYFSLHITIQSRNGLWLLCRIKDDTSKWWFFMICGQLMRHLFTKPFHLSNLLQMPNDCRMIYIQFFDNFMCSCKRIGFDDCSQLVVVCFWWLATILLIFKLLCSLQNFLNQQQFLGQMHCWCCELSLMLYDLFWTQIKKNRSNFAL